MPEQYSTIAAATTEKTLVARMPRDAGCLFFVTTEGLDLLAQIPEIEQLQ